MKKLLVILGILALVVIVGCASEEVSVEPTTDSSDLASITGDVIAEPVVVEEDPDTPPIYKFTKAQAKEVLGKAITVHDIGKDAEIPISVGTTRITLFGTKNAEIVGDLMISTQRFEYKLKDDPENYVELKIEKLDLGPNQYVIYEKVKIAVEGKQVILDNSRMDGAIYISVYEPETRKSENSDKINTGASEEVNGLTITNVENFYRNGKYALVQID